MLNKINYSDLSEAVHNSSHAKQHFSFTNSSERHNSGLGNILVLNDEIAEPHSGFPMHPHRNIEVLTYIIDGKLTHKDSTGKEHIVSSGEMEYMSAGSGIYHSEFNETDDNTRLLQIWLVPNIKNGEPNYGFITPKEEDIINKLHGVINTHSENHLLKTDVKVFLSKIVKGKIVLPMLPNEVGYLINIEGETTINDLTLRHGDGLQFDEDLTIISDNAHVFMLVT